MHVLKSLEYKYTVLRPVISILNICETHQYHTMYVNQVKGTLKCSTMHTTLLATLYNFPIPDTLYIAPDTLIFQPVITIIILAVYTSSCFYSILLRFQIQFNNSSLLQGKIYYFTFIISINFISSSHNIQTQCLLKLKALDLPLPVCKAA